MSILSLNDVSLILANQCILNHVNWQIQANDRIALVGRNGAGKTTLLRLLQGEIVQDSGQINSMNGLRIAGLSQDVPNTQNELVFHVLVKGLGELGNVLGDYYVESKSNHLQQLAKQQEKIDELHAWEWLPRIESMATRLGLDPREQMNNLSGGKKRQVLLAAALIAAPDLLILDEPTNHLDIEAIEWLESYLKSYAGSVLVVTHDRTFLSNIANRIVEIDRGQLYQHDCNYETYLDRREAMRLSEHKAQALFDKRLQEEEAWLRTGIKARRTRNEGRVRALKAMRDAYQQRRLEVGKIRTMALDVERSGKLVIEAKNVSYQIGNKELLRNFSLLLTRGDKVGIIGPNGCGKTTLVRLLLGELMPSMGEIRRGTSLSIAYFDQLRDQLDEQQTLMANVGEGGEFVSVNGKQKHVASYLREFLFTSEQFNQPVASLSGGERTRLLLAKLFTKPANLLIMDEPTNDLDIETLEFLESMLMDYPGTLLVISHDRAFINQIVTSVLIFEEGGCCNEYVGGYDDYRRYKKQQLTTSSQPSVRRNVNVNKLSFNEQRELTQLPQQIEDLEQHIALLQSEMIETTFYQQEADKITAFKRNLVEKETALAALYKRWEILESKRDDTR